MSFAFRIIRSQADGRLDITFLDDSNNPIGGAESLKGTVIVTEVRESGAGFNTLGSLLSMDNQQGASFRIALGRIIVKVFDLGVKHSEKERRDYTPSIDAGDHHLGNYPHSS